MSCFNGATLSRAWKLQPDLGLPPPRERRFNGATSSTNVETRGLGAIPAWTRLASMEPRLKTWKRSAGLCSESGSMLQWSHAQPSVETAPSHRGNLGAPGFNGATLSRAWKPRRRSRRARSAGWCFNGATLSRTWKLVARTPSGSIHAYTWLQWSHAQPNVETTTVVYRASHAAV